MVHVSGSSKEENQSFDFSSPLAVMAILKVLRAHDGVSGGERNEIRNLIFSYINAGGGDAERLVIEARLNAIGITPGLVAQASTRQSARAKHVSSKRMPPQAGFATGRATPQFASGFTTVSKPKTADLPHSATSATESKNTTDTAGTQSVVARSPRGNQASTPTSIPTTPEIQVQPPAFVETEEVKIAVPPTVTPKSVSANNVSNAPDPQLIINEPSTSTNQKPTANASIPVESNNTPELTSTDSVVDTTACLERIRVIKADINARAGNPVQLVAINNDIGREYMTALLEAMKQLGGGSSRTVSAAMQRLELAYERALSILEATPMTKATPSQSASDNGIVAPTGTVSPVIPVSPVPVSNATLASRIEPHVPTNASVHNPPLGVTRSSLAPKTVDQSSISSSATPIPRQPVAPMSAVPSVQNSASVPVVPQSVPVPSHASAVAPVPEIVPIHSSKLSPVADAKPLRRVEELPTRNDVRHHSESGNPLYTLEISEGLEQLLSEWTIFRKSGILGTGPKGSNHPLFKRLAPLQIPLILAGRFEGASEEIRQSITDYMNGWRYEQGVVYEKNETFEQYLRRVIKHIIDQHNVQT
jgi:hypothetical protein